MNDTPPRKIDDWAEAWRKLIGPMVICALGCFGFIYEITTGHDATLGTISAGLAAAAAGFSADILRRFS